MKSLRYALNNISYRQTPLSWYPASWMNKMLVHLVCSELTKKFIEHLSLELQEVDGCAIRAGSSIKIRKKRKEERKKNTHLIKDNSDEYIIVQ